jgi:hypothetical protein
VRAVVDARGEAKAKEALLMSTFSENVRFTVQ